MNKIIEDEILKVTKANQISDIQEIQKLWSGYGTLSRIICDNTSVILKHIELPTHNQHPKGWNTDISHERKMKSYSIEKNWYESYNKNILHARFPKSLCSSTLESSEFFILEDMANFGFQEKDLISQTQVEITLRWLANFHAYFLNTKPSGLWSIGTYWNLETRPQEFSKLEDSELKGRAALIDKVLNSAKFQTLVHGDAKLANFLYRGEVECCAVDFQYVGGGAGIKDVMYFLSSIYSDQELFEFEEVLLASYFKELRVALKRLNKEHLFLELEIEWRYLYSFTWADFVRFLKGWSPEHFKLNSYSLNQTQKALDDLKRF